jgi:hypothetical protein
MKYLSGQNSLIAGFALLSLAYYIQTTVGELGHPTTFDDALARGGRLLLEFNRWASVRNHEPGISDRGHCDTGADGLLRCSGPDRRLFHRWLTVFADPGIAGLLRSGEEVVAETVDTIAGRAISPSYATISLSQHFRDGNYLLLTVKFPARMFNRDRYSTAFHSSTLIVSFFRSPIFRSPTRQWNIRAVPTTPLLSRHGSVAVAILRAVCLVLCSHRWI